MAVITGVHTICWGFSCHLWVRLLMVRPKETSISLTAVYGWWCCQIAESLPSNGVCDVPFMFQCTWCIPFGDSGQPNSVLLGGLVSGIRLDTRLDGYVENGSKTCKVRSRRRSSSATGWL